MPVRFVKGPPPPSKNAPQERPGRIEYLYLSKEQRAAADAMNEAIDNLPPFSRLRCQTPRIKRVGRKIIAYYPHTDYDERTPPTEDEADLMCKTTGQPCPLVEQCLKLGRVLEPSVGVWGGRTFVDGRDYYLKEEHSG